MGSESIQNGNQNIAHTLRLFPDYKRSGASMMMRCLKEMGQILYFHGKVESYLKNEYKAENPFFSRWVGLGLGLGLVLVLGVRVMVQG
jgi:hypothetical protein